ncbi:MAG: hypothetical protein M1469_03260, partial [Bacteroidetes bacterium]|nr:hypothetical protein [Bacteroidota bacterium]
ISWPENDSNHSEDINCFSVLNGNIFAGTYHGIFVSTDEGSSWHADNAGLPIIYTGHPPTITDLVVEGGNLFASSGGPDIYRSTNGGASWAEVDSIGGDFHRLATIGSEVFASAFYDLGKPWTGGVFVSKDNGKSWQRADADLPDHGVNAICAGGTNLFLGTNAAIYFSSDRGSTWINISSGSGIDGGGATALYVYDSFLFANSGSVRRYPLFLLPEFTQNMKNEISNKPQGG